MTFIRRELTEFDDVTSREIYIPVSLISEIHLDENGEFQFMAYDIWHYPIYRTSILNSLVELRDIKGPEGQVLRDIENSMYLETRCGR